MPQPQYAYRAVNALTGTRVSELPLIAGHFARQLSGAGAWDAVLPLSPSVTALDPMGSTVPYGIEIVVERLSPQPGSVPQVVYCGLLTDREYDSRNQQLRISGRESWAYFDKRMIEWNVTYNPTDQGLIVQDLLTRAAGSPNGDFRVDLPTTAQLTTGTTRQIQYQTVDCQPISAAIEQLGTMQNGFEFSLDGYWSPAGVLRHRLAFAAPRLGTRGGLVASWDIPGGVIAYRWLEQGFAMGNEVFAVGDDGAGHVLLQRVKQYAGSQPLLQIIGSFRPVTFGATLQAWAAQLVARTVVPVVQAYVTVDGMTAPEFGTYGLGDDVALQFADLRFGNVAGLWRILGWTLYTPDERQAEAVELAVAAT